MGRMDSEPQSFSEQPGDAPAEQPAERDAEAGVPDRSAVIGARLRAALVWAGIITLVALSVLALFHLLVDLDAVFSIRGGRSAIVARLLPTLLVGSAAVALTIVVAWLAGSGRRRELIAIGIGLVLLVGVRVYLSSQFDGGSHGEPMVYRVIAETFLTSEWDAMSRPVGYPALLAGAYAFIADRQLAAEVVNLLLAVLAGGVVLGLARGLYGPRAGVLALLGYAMWPAGALMTVVSIPQTAFDLTIAAAAWVAIAMPPGWRGHVATGVVVALAQYLRPTAPALLPAFILARMWPGGSWQRLLGAAVVPVIAFLLVLTPVMWQNYERSGSLSITTSGFGGQALYLGTYEPSGGTFDEEAIATLTELAGPEPSARSALGTEIALERIKSDPIGIAALGIRKQDTLWGTEHFGAQYAIKQSLKDRAAHPRVTTPLLLSQAFYVIVLIMATIGMYSRRREPDALIPLVITMIWTIAAIHALLEVRDRHHSYVIPLLLPLAALVLASMAGSIERRLGRSRTE